MRNMLDRPAGRDYAGVAGNGSCVSRKRVNERSSDLSRGQSLIEVILAMVVVALLVTGVVAGTTSSLKTVRFGQSKSQAVKYAQEGLELARQLRGLGWTDFAAKSGLWCLDKAGSWSLATGSCSANIDNVFTRGVEFTWDGVNEKMEVKVNVSWIEGSLIRSTELITYFTQWL